MKTQICETWHSEVVQPLSKLQATTAHPTFGTPSTRGPLSTRYNESELGGVTDRADEAIYAAAVGRFEAAVRAFGGPVEECIRAVRATQTTTRLVVTW